MDAGRTKKIRRSAVTSGSDEAIVSVDPAGQHNRPVSQGPLDERVRSADPANMPYGATGFGRADLGVV
jgi:hypothetical protein